MLCSICLKVHGMHGYQLVSQLTQEKPFQQRRPPVPSSPLIPVAGNSNLSLSESIWQNDRPPWSRRKRFYGTEPHAVISLLLLICSNVSLWATP